MSSVTYTVYVEATGQLLAHVSCSEGQLEGNLTAWSNAVGQDVRAHDGALRLGQQYIDPTTREVSDVQSSPESQAEAEREMVLRRIEALEAQQKPRLVREAVLGDEEAITRVRQIDQEIVALRAAIASPVEPAGE